MPIVYIGYMDNGLFIQGYTKAVWDYLYPAMDISGDFCWVSHRVSYPKASDII